MEHAQRPSKYIKDLNNFDVSGIKFPVTLNQIEKFEQQNPDFLRECVQTRQKERDKLDPAVHDSRTTEKVSRKLTSDWKHPETALYRH